MFVTLCVCRREMTAGVCGACDNKPSTVDHMLGPKDV